MIYVHNSPSAHHYRESHDLRYACDSRSKICRAMRIAQRIPCTQVRRRHSIYNQIQRRPVRLAARASWRKREARDAISAVSACRGHAIVSKRGGRPWLRSNIIKCAMSQLVAEKKKEKPRERIIIGGSPNP